MTSRSTSFLSSSTSVRRLETSLFGCEKLATAEIEGVATSMIWSASVASSLTFLPVPVEARTILTFPGSLCKNNSRMNEESIVLALSPRSCSMRRNNWEGFRSPSSSELKSCCNSSLLRGGRSSD